MGYIYETLYDRGEPIFCRASSLEQKLKLLSDEYFHGPMILLENNIFRNTIGIPTILG